MPSVRTVNMAWERKVRGSYAVSRFAVNDAGTVTLVLPRPLQARAHDLTRLALDGSAEVRSTFSVETLLELEASGESDSVIGMTADDLYLIRGGDKNRFLSERRIIFVDSAMSLDGTVVAAGFSDVAGSSFALAFGDITGRVVWLREADAPLSAVALSPEGGFICQGADTGSIWLIGSSRREQWLFEQAEPVRALACAPGGRSTAYGTSGGTVGMIDSEGSRTWEAHLPGAIVSLALSADAGICAALVRPTPDDGTDRLYVLDDAGQIGWEYESELRLTGIAVSPDGRYLVSSGRGGTHTLYTIVFGQAAAAMPSEASGAEALSRAEQCAATQDWVGAAASLRGAIHDCPDEVEACERLLALQREAVGSLLGRTAACCEAGEFASAMELLNQLRVVAPEEPDLYVALADVRKRWTNHEVAQADEHLESGDFDGASDTLTHILTFAPLAVEARRRIADLNARRARETDAEADRLLAAQDAEAALAALERAQQIAASAERAERIRRAQIDLEFADGMRAYNEKRYREAVFQFKKVLVRDPDHADARRHLNFAQRFEQDSNEALNDRFGRLE